MDSDNSQNSINNFNKLNLPSQILQIIESLHPIGYEYYDQQSLSSQINYKNKRRYDQSDSNKEDQKHRKSQSRSFKRSRKDPKKEVNYDEPNVDEEKKLLEIKESTVKTFVDYELKDKQKIYDINGIATYFPHTPYPLQITYMRRVIQALQNRQNAVLQSPTGTGKTLCLLSSTLSWIHKQKLQGRHRKVIYLSRTHSQLQQTQRQLKKTCFRPTMTHVGSRDRLCVKQQLRELHGEQKKKACQKGVRLFKDNRKRPIIINGMTQSQKQQMKTQMCIFYKQKDDIISMGNNHFANKVFSMQEFIDYGKNEYFCPYFYPFHMQRYCDIIFMPYNYILNINLLPRFKDLIEKSVLIFDEAHNVPEASCQGRSHEILSQNLVGAQGELAKIFYRSNLPKQLNRFRKSIKQLLDYSNNLKETISDYINRINYQRCPNFNEKLYAGQQDEVIKVIGTQDMYLALYEMFKGVMLSQDNRLVFKSKGHYFKNSLSEMVQQIYSLSSKLQDFVKVAKQKIGQTYSNIESIFTFLKKAANLIQDSIEFKTDFLNTEINHFRLGIKLKLQGKPQIKKYSVILRCLVPWLTFQNITQLNPHSIIFTSGTLSPIQNWQEELDIDAPITLVNTHIITEKQVSLNILCKNIEGNPFDFRFKSMNQNGQNIYDQLIQTIFQISKNVPNGMLVICPNFKILHKLKVLVNRYDYKKRMNSVKKQIFEEKQNENYIDQFKQKSQFGAILYCVCRGKASEGIDFPDHNCRAVVFVGVPFPNISDPILIERKEHFGKMQKHRKSLVQKTKFGGISWEKWYFNNTIRAIGQSLGRLIRHAKDYGMLFLLDQRYCQSRFKNAMPKWTQRSVNIWQQFTIEQVQNIEQFYTLNASLFPEKGSKIGNYDKFQKDKVGKIQQYWEVNQAKEAKIVKEEVTKFDKQINKSLQKKNVQKQIQRPQTQTAKVKDEKVEDKVANKQLTLLNFFKKKQNA